MPIRIRGLTFSVLFALVLAACGSSKSSSTSATKGQAPTSTTSSSTPAGTSTASSGKSTPTTTAAIHATLTGENHTPKVNQNWTYTVRVTSADGKALSGTAVTEFTFGGQVVGKETPPVHAIKNGVLHDSLQFPSQAAGQPISLQVVVHTNAGSKTLDWPVKVQP